MCYRTFGTTCVITLQRSKGKTPLACLVLVSSLKLRKERRRKEHRGAGGKSIFFLGYTCVSRANPTDSRPFQIFPRRFGWHWIMHARGPLPCSEHADEATIGWGTQTLEFRQAPRPGRCNIISPTPDLLSLLHCCMPPHLVARLRERETGRGWGCTKRTRGEATGGRAEEEE